MPPLTKAAPVRRSNHRYPSLPRYGSGIFAPGNRGLVERYVTGHSPADTPLHELVIDLTHACSARCLGCADGPEMLSTHYASLPTEELADLAYRLPELGVQVVKFYGGEPTLHPGFATLLRALSRNGIQVFVSTNGFHLKQHAAAIRETREYVTIRVSLNAGTRRTHTRIFRPRDRRAHFVQILRDARRPSEEGVRVSMSVVVRREVVNELFYAAKHARNTGAESITFKPLIDPSTKSLQTLPTRTKSAVRREIEAARMLETPTFQVRVSETMEKVFSARRPRDLAQPKPFRTCPFTSFRAVLSPPGILHTCPYHRGSETHVIEGGPQRLNRDWLASPERAQGVARPDARRDCPFFCDRGRAASMLHLLRRRFREEGPSVLSELPVLNRQHPFYI